MTTVTVVTGAAGTMGAATALALGTTVDVILLTDQDEDRLASAAERIGAATTATVATMAGDLGEPDLVAELAERAQAFGGLRSLVHTAGLSPSMAPWQDILQVDLVASARLLGAFLPLAEPGAVAVCVASIAGHIGTFEPNMDDLLDDPFAADLESRFQAVIGDDPDPGTTYRLAKRGVLRLCERAAVSWGAKGGRVVSISPGLIDTAMGRLELVENPIKVEMAEMTPVGAGRSDSPLPGLTADIADTIAFLCSDRAAFISGCDIRVDGGLVAAMTFPSPPDPKAETPTVPGTEVDGQ